MKKNMFQRLTCSLLALLMVLSMAAAPVSAAAAGADHAEAVRTAQVRENESAKSFTVTPVGTLTAQSTQATFRSACSDSSLSSVNVFLLPVGQYGPDEEKPVARKFGASVGDVTLDIHSLYSFGQ